MCCVLHPIRPTPHHALTHNSTSGCKVIENIQGVVAAGDRSDPIINKLAATSVDNRDACRKLLKVYGKDNGDKLVVPIQDPGSKCSHIVYPHELFAFLLGFHPAEFTRRFKADTTHLSHFWAAMRTSMGGAELFDSHPHLRHRTPAELAHTIPIVVHSDAGPFAKAQGLQLVQWGSLIGSGADIEQRFPALVWLSKYGDAASHKGVFEISLKTPSGPQQKQTSTCCNILPRTCVHCVPWRVLVLIVCLYLCICHPPSSQTKTIQQQNQLHQLKHIPCCSGWELVGKSLDVLATGKMPMVPLHSGLGAPLDNWRLGRAGTSFGGWSAVWLFALGDCDFFVNDLGLPSYNSLDPCGLCRCNVSTIPWNDFALNAAWMLTCHTNAEYCGRHVGKDHPIWGWVGLSKHSVRFDTLHIVDHHGVASKAIGTLFVEICADGELCGGNKEENLAILNDRIKTFQQESRERNPCPKLYWKNLTFDGDSWPELHGPVIKGATTKSLAGFCCFLTNELNDGSEYKARRAALFAHLLEFNTIVDGSGTFLTDAQKLRLKTCVHAFLLNYSWLARVCAIASLFRWHIVPKFHYFAHLPAQADVCNLRDTRCYLEESSIGRFAKVFRNSANGPYHKRVQHVVLVKFVLGLQLRFRRTTGW